MNNYPACEYFKCKEEGRDQESIQSSTTPDPRDHYGKLIKTQGNISHKRAKRSALSQQVTTRNRQGGRIKINMKHKYQMDPQKKHHLGRVIKKINGGLKHVKWYQPHKSDVDQET